MNIVYSKTALITGQCDEHVLSLRERQSLAALPEIDNDQLIQEYVRDLLDYLFRAVWPLCDVKRLPAPYVLARLCELNATAFDEEGFEFGSEPAGNILVLRRERGLHTQAQEPDVDADADDGLANDSY